MAEIGKNADECIAGVHRSQINVSKMKYSYLGKTDMLVSHLGFGSSAIGGHYGSVSEDEGVKIVHAALRKGINYIDTAPWYKAAEDILGKALALACIPRNAYYMATKVGRYSEQDYSKMFDFSAEKTMQSIDDSLRKLNCGYLDVIQVHDLEFAPNLEVIFNETLPTLQKAKDMGKVHYIGITGYPLDTLKAVVEGSPIPIDTVLSYCRCCLHDTALLDYIDFFKSKGMGVIDAAALGMGLYGDGPLPDWHPAPTEIREACHNARKYCQDNSVSLSKLAVHFNLNQQGPDTHLISYATLDILNKNVEVYDKGLLPMEKYVLESELNKFFQPLKTRNWEGVEVKKYWNKIASGQTESSLKN